MTYVYIFFKKISFFKNLSRWDGSRTAENDERCGRDSGLPQLSSRVGISSVLWQTWTDEVDHESDSCVNQKENDSQLVDDSG